MARAHVYQVLESLGPPPELLINASIRVVDQTLVAIPDDLWTTDGGSGVLSNPFTAVNGVVDFYLDNPQRIVLGVTPSGGTEFTVVIDANPPAGEIMRSTDPVVLPALGANAKKFMRVTDDGTALEFAFPGLTVPFSTPSTQWVATHNLGRPPVVMCFDPSGNEIGKEVTLNTAAQTRCDFYVPVSGTMTLS